MRPWKTGLIAASPALLLLLLLLFLALAFCCSRPGRSSGHGSRGAVVKMQKRKRKRKWRQRQRRRRRPKPFVWSDNPGLIVEAAERGWIAFAFSPASPAKGGPSDGEHCEADEEETETEMEMEMEEERAGERGVEIGWEMRSGEGSWGPQYVQRLRLNPRHGDGDGEGRRAVQVVQAALPLPGPVLGPDSYPQKAYFEITIATEPGPRPEPSSEPECEQALFPAPQAGARSHGYGDSHGNGYGDSYGNGYGYVYGRDPIMPRGIVAIGLAPGAEGEGGGEGGSFSSSSLRLLPGCRPGSVGLHSDGCIYVSGVVQASLARGEDEDDEDGDEDEDGNKKVGRSGGKKKKKKKRRRQRWWDVEEEGSGGAMVVVVGCGFDPAARVVWFTMNGEMVGELELDGNVSARSRASASARASASTNNSASASASANNSASSSASATTNTSDGGDGGGGGIDGDGDGFGHPLYPTVAADCRVTMLANFGQCPFAYAAANGGRVPDPARPRPGPGPGPSGPSIIDDSGDLFSIGRIDSRWLDAAAADDPLPRSGSSVGRSQHRHRHHHPLHHPRHHPNPASSASAASAAPPPIIIASSSELDSDLFEIVLGHSRHNDRNSPIRPD